MSLYLFGTNHLDTKGPARLKTFLDIIRPEIVACESCEKEARLRIENHQEIIREFKTSEKLLRLFHGDENYEKIFLLSSVIGYEVWVSNEYVKTNSATDPLYFDEELVVDQEMINIRKDLFGEESIDNSGEATVNFFEHMKSIELAKYQQDIDKNYYIDSVDAFTKSENIDFS